MTSPLLITAFSAFPGVAENPTQSLLSSLPASGDPVLARARRVLLPTLYGEAPTAMMAAISPMTRAVVMTGYSNHARTITLERRANSAVLPNRPDAGGYCPPSPQGVIRACGTDADIAALTAALSASGIDADVSDDAGSYVCNHLYHAALTGPCALPDGPLGLFVHLPALPGTELAATASGTMHLAAMQRALGVIARELLAVNTLSDSSALSGQ